MLNEKQALRIIMRKMRLLTKASRFMLCSSVVLELELKISVCGRAQLLNSAGGKLINNLVVFIGHTLEYLRRDAFIE